MHPVIMLPERPELQPLPSGAWAELPEEVRVTITDNQSILFTYIEQLETAIYSYNAWAARQKLGENTP